MKLILLANRNVTFLCISCVQGNLLHSKALFANLKFELFNIINPTLFIGLYHYFWYLLCLRINNYCFVSDYSTAFIGEPWLFLKTRQIQMWIFVNMIMEIDVWLVNKKQVSHTDGLLVSQKFHVYRGSLYYQF